MSVFFLQKTQITIYQLPLFASCRCVFLIVMSLTADVLGSFAKLRKATIFATSVRPSAWSNSAPTVWIFMILFGTRGFFENLSRKFKFYENLLEQRVLYMKTNIHCFIISGAIILRMKNVSHKIYRETRNSRFMLNNYFSKILLL
jgi:hypothetical protein